MARIQPGEHAKNHAAFHKRLWPRQNPFPEGRPASLDDLVFLSANLSRLVIDPYREACRIDTDIGGKLALARPFLVSGLDDAPDQVRAGAAQGLAEGGSCYLGAQSLGAGIPWLQLLNPGATADPRAQGIVHVLAPPFRLPKGARCRDDQILGLAVSVLALLEQAIPFALEHGFDMLLLDGGGGIGRPGAELATDPDLTILRDGIAILRRLGREEAIDLAYFGGVRTGTDAAKVIALGAKVVVLDVLVALAAGGAITEEGRIAYSVDRTEDDRAQGVANILSASAGEASMMARCTGKTVLHNLEPEDIRAITIATAQATGVPLAGTR